MILKVGVGNIFHKKTTIFLNFNSSHFRIPTRLEPERYFLHAASVQTGEAAFPDSQATGEDFGWSFFFWRSLFFVVEKF